MNQSFSSAERERLLELLDKAISNLPDPERLIMELLRADPKLDTREIAAKLRMSENRVEEHKKKALELLEPAMNDSSSDVRRA